MGGAKAIKNFTLVRKKISAYQLSRTFSKCLIYYIKYLNLVKILAESRRLYEIETVQCVCLLTSRRKAFCCSCLILSFHSVLSPAKSKKLPPTPDEEEDDATCPRFERLKFIFGGSEIATFLRRILLYSTCRYYGIKKSFCMMQKWLLRGKKGFIVNFQVNQSDDKEKDEICK